MSIAPARFPWALATRAAPSRNSGPLKRIGTSICVAERDLHLAGELERDAGATGGYVLQPDASAATRPVVFGVRVFITSHVRTGIVVADMRYVAVGVRDRWTAHFDPYRFSEFDQTAIRVTSRWAIAPLHTAAVQIVTTGVEVRAERENLGAKK